MDLGTSETRLGSPPSHPADIGGFTPGTVLADRYRIVAMVGRGGMGEVYRADDLRLGQPVALKFLAVTLEREQVARDRLLAEVRSARTVSHPNVCRVYDVGDVQGRVFLTMEYIDGEDLASLLRRIGRLPAAKALEIARQLCAGLAAAHECGVLHRDLKPANVMIDGRGQARITDFGLAVEVPAGTATEDGSAHDLREVAGTIAYLAPERFEGKPATAQSDLYALGLVLYEVYTGKPAISATTLEGWRRAHSDSTPSHPSIVVSEIEPAVERAILRCLEKDPAKRPASAAQLAASLPGGDPLAAAIAAGETPSPELVAAAGEEGTLPRATAWLWLAACLVALVLAVTLGSLSQLANVLPLNNPLLQRTAARQILDDLGYRYAAADAAGTYDRDDDYLMRLVRTRPPRAWFTEPAHAGVGPLQFCYRQSRGSLFSSGPFGTIGVFEPAPRYPDDVYLELDGVGRLVTLRVGGLGFNRAGAPAGQPVDWNRLFAAAGLDPAMFSDTTVEWPAVVTADESRAWEGHVGGKLVRVEASAYRGRAVQFVRPAEIKPYGGPPPDAASVEWALDAFLAGTVFVCVGVLAILARHNQKHGRGDKKGAYRVAVAVFAVETLYLLFERHWTLRPLDPLRVLIFCLGLPFFAGTQTWLYYMGVEPFVRRRWPQLLIAWTRLLDGRWRDPLVGRSLLAGTCAALIAAGIVPGVLAALTRAFSLPLAVPGFVYGTLDGGLFWFLGGKTNGWLGAVYALMLLAILLVMRLVFRHDRLAWPALFLVMFGIASWETLYANSWASAAPIGPLVRAAVLAGIPVVLTARKGLLAAAIFYTVAIALDVTPLTYDVTRWYFWRTGVVALLVVALAFWGFRNVLGRQSAFPAGALDQ